MSSAPLGYQNKARRRRNSSSYTTLVRSNLRKVPLKDGRVYENEPRVCLGGIGRADVS
jgi:hypothetical protein